MAKSGEDFAHEATSWEASLLGVLSARQEFETLCNELVRVIEESNAGSEKFKVGFSRKGNDKCVLSSLGYSLIIQWICPRPDSLEDSVLSVNGFRTDVEEGQQSHAEANRFTQASYRIELSKDLKIRWGSTAGNPYYYAVDLAASLLATLLEALRDKIVYKRD